MPKIKRKEISALKKVRNFFPNVELNSDSEDSFTSDSSNELLQHIPVKTEVPNLENITLEEPTMDELNVKINRIGELLEALTEKSREHDDLLRNINTNNNPNQNIPPGPSNAQQQQNNEQECRIVDLFRIPDPIKSIPSFDGNRKQLSAWITTAENTLHLFKNKVSEPI